MDRGEVKAHALFGEDMTSKRRMARMVLVGGEKERVGDSGSVPRQICNTIDIRILC